MKTNCIRLSLAAGLWLSLATAALSQPPDTARGPAGAERGGPPRGAEMFDRFDENEDGKLGKDEVPERLWNRLSRLDANEDGVITKEELAKIREAFQGRPARGNRPRELEERSARKEVKETETKQKPDRKQPRASARKRPSADRPGPRRATREMVKKERDRKGEKKVDKKGSESKKRSDIKRPRASRFAERPAGRRPGGRSWAGRAPGRQGFQAGNPPWMSCPRCGQSYRGGRQAWQGRRGGPPRGHGMMQRRGRGRGHCPFAAGPSPRMRKHYGRGPSAQAAAPPWARMNKPWAPQGKGPRDRQVDRDPRGPRGELPGPRREGRMGPGPRAQGPAAKDIDRDRGPDSSDAPDASDTPRKEP